jgi:hypothetical protein
MVVYTEMAYDWMVVILSNWRINLLLHMDYVYNMGMCNGSIAQGDPAATRKIFS